MTIIEDLLRVSPYSLSYNEREHIFLKAISQLTTHHIENCSSYKKIVEMFGDDSLLNSINNIPFIPVRLFKDLVLKSISDAEVFKILKSSGTSGQTPSRIYINKIVAENQRRVLSKLVAEFIGPIRLPMLIIDSKKTLKDPKSFTARGAGILGFSMFGKNIMYALDEKMRLDIENVLEFLEKNKNTKLLIFGFTSIVWLNFINQLKKEKLTLPIANGILIHGGGWKKLARENITNDHFKELLNQVSCIEHVHNYYGMIEQTGSIFFECEKGFFHTSIFSDIIVRNDELEPVSNKTKGLIQLLSLLPVSYPGHSLLTDDWGEVIGNDDCLCGRKGKYFRVFGRIKNAEVRGCSDTIT